jgi:glycosyltransferase involved in cell wall biosynthesis
MTDATGRVVVHVTNCWYPMVGGITTTVAGLVAAAERHLNTQTRVIAYPAGVHTWVVRPSWPLARRAVHAGVVATVIARALGVSAWQRIQARQVVVHSHSAAFCMVAAALATLFGCRAVHTVSSSVFDQPPRPGWATRVYRWAARKCVVVYCCDFLRREQWSILQPPESDVIFSGVDTLPLRETQEPSRLREAIGEREGPLIVLAGHLIPRKDPLLAVDAMPLVPAGQLVLLGDGPLEADIDRRAKKIGVRDRVHLLGAVERSELLAYLTDADVLLITSRAEGIPLVLYEAMMVGAPVVTVPVSGIPEIVADGKTGYVASERTGEKVAAAIRRALEDEDGDELVRRARTHVIENCSWPAMIARYARHYAFPDGEPDDG